MRLCGSVRNRREQRAALHLALALIAECGAINRSVPKRFCPEPFVPHGQCHS